MDQRELMRKGDGSKPDQFMIVLVMPLQDPANLMKESREFLAIVTDWYKARGADAEGVNLIAVSDQKYHKAILDWFVGVLALDVRLRPIFNKISSKLALYDSAGAKTSECAFAPGELPRDGAFEALISRMSTSR